MRKTNKRKIVSRTPCYHAPMLQGLEQRTLLSAIGLTVTTANPFFTNNTTPAIAGTVDDNTADVSISILQGGNTVGTWQAQTDGSGGWSFAVPDADALVDGQYDLKVTAVDNDGADTGELDLSNALIIDTAVPTVSFDNGQIPAAVNSDFVLTGAYSDEDISTVVVQLDDGHGGTFSYNATIDTNAGTWSAPISLSGVPDGIYDVSVTASDLAGNSASQSAGGRLTVDATPPTVSIDNGQLPVKLNADTVLTGTYSDDNISDVVVKLDNGHGDIFSFSTTLDSSTQTWSVPVSITGLADGSYSVSVVATDLAGNSTTENGAGFLTVDTVADVTVNSQQSNVDTVTLSGTVGADVSSLEATVDGATYSLANGDIVIAGGTHWSLDLPALSDGTYSVSVTAVDDIGNTATVNGQLLIDTTAPTVTIDPGQLPSTVNTDTSLTGAFNDANISSILVTLDDGHGGTFNFSADLDNSAGTWNAAVPIAGLADGSYAISVTATDIVGNSTTSSSADSLTVDTTINVAVNNLISNANTVTLTGTVDADVATLEIGVGGTTYTLAGGDIALSGNNWSLSLPSLADGNYTTSVTATDSVGNTHTVDGSLIIDTTAPTIAFDAGQLPAFIGHDVTLTGTFDDANIDAIAITLDDGEGHAFTYNATINAADGTWSVVAPIADLTDGTSYNVSAIATDLAGNSGTQDAVGVLTVDTTAPVVAFDDGQLPLRTNTDVTLTGTFEETNIADITVTLDDGHGGVSDVHAAIDTDSQTWSVTLPISDLADGSYNVSVTATDLAGNSTVQSAAGALTVDTTAGVSVNDLLSNANTVTLTGTVDPDIVTMEVTVNGTTYSLANGDITVSGADWSLNLPALADGDYAVSVSAADDLGNQAAVEGRLLIDTVAPLVTLDPGQLPAITDANRSLTGTFDDANIASIVVTLDDGHGGVFTFNATVDADSNTWNALVTVGGLSDAAYAVTVTATDLVGNTTSINAGLLTVDTTAPTATTTTTVTSNNRPGLSGTVDDPTATVVISIGNVSAIATNNGDGTWTLPAGTISRIPDGNYRITLTATDPAGNQSIFNNAFIIIDTTAPVVTVNRLTTTNSSPALSGTVDDNAATIVVTINGASYDAVNNGDGTWTLAAGTIAPLSQGTYHVSVTATDEIGNVGTNTSSNELTIGSSQSVTMGAGISKVTYVDADGTTVVLTAGRGNLVINFVGQNLVISGTGAARTITGAVESVNVTVVADSTSLVITPRTGGDGVTTINQITGSGNLNSLVGPRASITGGIQMTGVIKSIRLHNIQSDIVMGAWAKGVTIVADTIRNCTIQTDYIATVSAGILSNSTIQSGFIKSLIVRVLYQNSTVNAASVQSALLWNVDTDNGGVGFGLQVPSIKQLLVVQAGAKLKWKTNFVGSIGDFNVSV